MSDVDVSPENGSEPEAAATATIDAPIALGSGNGHAYDELAGIAAVAAAGGDADLSIVFDLPVELAVEIGRTTMTIRETLAIAPGTLIQLNRLAGEPALNGVGFEDDEGAFHVCWLLVGASGYSGERRYRQREEQRSAARRGETR